MHIYVHIGLHKTGTSSIQTLFHKHRKELLDAGINYLDLGRNHSVPLFSLASTAPHLYSFNSRVGIDTPEKADAHNRRLKARLDAAFRAEGASKAIVSGEDLSFLDREGIERLRALLLPYGATMSVIAYVRDPIATSNSLAQESLKEGRLLSEFEAGPPRPDHRGRLSGFIDAFGRDGVDIRVFREADFVGGDLIRDFLAAIGERPERLDHLPRVRRNKAMSAEAGRILDRANVEVPLIVGGRLNPRRDLRLATWVGRVDGTPFSLNARLTEEVRAALEEDVEWLHANLGRDVFAIGDFTPQAAAWGEATAASLARVLNAMALKITTLSAGLLIERSRRIARRDPKKARDLLLRRLPRHSAIARYHYRLSRLHARLGDEDEAARAAKRALELAPDVPAIRRWAAGFGDRG